MNKKFEPDEMDYAILQKVQEDGRISYRSLSREIPLSTPVIIERIRRMEDVGIIKRFTVDIDHGKLGFSVKAILSMSIDNKDPATDIFDRILSIPEVLDCWRVTGNDDYVLRVIARSMSHLDEVLFKLCVFGKTNTSIILSEGQDLDIKKIMG